MARFFRKPRFGWRGPDEARRAWEYMHERFLPFGIDGKTDRKRTCAWDAWGHVGFDPTQTCLWGQQTGDCVSFGAAKVVAAVAIWEIAKLGEPERFRVPFPPYLYGISRVTPEGGNGRLRGQAGSLGSWMADTIVKYGVLAADDDGVPQYSGRTADTWGNSDTAWRKFVPGAQDHLIRRAARLQSIDAIIDAICNGYFVTIASMKGYSMRLKDDRNKSWFVGNDNWPHQMSLIAYDTDPEPCFFRDNQWKDAHGPQLDGPSTGGWIRLDSTFEREVRDGGTEIFAYSMFDGYPSEENKPRNWYA